MAVDRLEVVRRADEFISQGKLELAIAEYQALVEEQPGDLSAANTLGDLYARHGAADKAIEQFTRLAESERSQGFSAKAVALYKKALKVDPGCELALSRLADIAVGQALLADATLYWNRLLQRQRSRNDDAGVVETLIRLAGLPGAKADTKLVAARGADRYAPRECARLFADAARALERESRPGEAIDAWLDAAQRSEDLQIRRAAAQACVAHGAPERAVPILTLDVAGDDPALLALLGVTVPADQEVAKPVNESPPVESAAQLEEIDVSAALEEDQPPSSEPGHVEPAFVERVVVRPVEVEPGPVESAPVEVPAAWADTEEAPLDEEAFISQLEVAAGTPALQFQAAAQLGRIFIQRGQFDRGVEWLRRARQAQAPVRDQALAAVYDLADTLERVGQHDQALAVWSDLEFDAGAYRDVSERLARLNSRRSSAR
jgi:tetratricopeptide (TPR) repeat protein